LEKLEAVLKGLQKRNLKVNASKSSFAVGALEYLGYGITREGIKPNPLPLRILKAMPWLNVFTRLLIV
jgi:hypothetical protein